LDTSFSSRFIHLTPVVPTIHSEVLYGVRHLSVEPWKRSCIDDGSVGEMDGQYVPTVVIGYMELTPAPSNTLSPVGRR
jgi:hypothetical protein